jgi:hypothetical protein
LKQTTSLSLRHLSSLCHCVSKSPSLPRRSFCRRGVSYVFLFSPFSVWRWFDLNWRLSLRIEDFFLF